MAAKRSPAYIMTEFPIIIVGHSGQMTTEAFGRLASWSSFNIVVGRHDEFAYSRVAIPQKRGTTAKSIVLHFPHPTHSNWKPRKDAIPPHPSQPLPEGPWDATQKSAKHA